ncbi:sporulation protein YjcZ [Paenibacillus thiaminolyticus]|uniref:Sporulation protein YjcZ n=1 Tax=Paenibacillus thiaminolyticus TaxID=49283 RepID=A0AAJ1FZP7_PANTH|nr:sporulation protein YjcZ [Paenibacillus thiaminolyticus]MCY9536220.1 sporulation protein YjcZ [Paenibacillus thiaminolyticus]MCY9603515.1 sporulation protein YjcZ [Paenibacillus thiaminolyticus]MCY9605649.1 sporulation protein YjcZ [Paenibacillus thiaminolyticus]MCY9611850.1 sporulation protein YjcZ [Paenibacillus thiaminolyticus]MCY9620951.1 sporulation protein YjcZ [Paenibacillus thiaminolyticus]
MAPVAKPAPVCGPGFGTSTGTILVLYILLVIILRAPLY